MKYLLNAGQMRICDEYTIQNKGMPSLVLMERAALAVRDAVLERFPGAHDILVICGSGNNGGDGFAAARLLNLAGKNAKILFVGKHDKMTEQTKREAEIFRNYSGEVLADESPVKGYDLIIDALFGIGLKREVIGRYADVIGAVNRLDTPVVAIDIPSGISADTGQVMGCAVRADLTVTMAQAKIGQMLYPGADYCGEVLVRDVGITDEGLYRSITSSIRSHEEEDRSDEEVAMALEEKDLADLLPGRIADANKGTYGKLLVIAGAVQMAGAAVMAGRAACRAGCGLVCVLSDEANRQILQTSLPEALYSCWSEEETVKQRLAWADAVAIGPGLGQSDRSLEILRMVLSSFRGPIVIDADALNLIAAHPEIIPEDGLKAVITPHPGEMSRLTRITGEGERSVPELMSDMVHTAEAFSREYRCVTVLKGARTVITDSERVRLNTAGNEGMATGGSGDVLTGIIGSFLAQGSDLFDASCAGVLLHALAGDCAAEELGSRSLMAGDIIRFLPKVLSRQAAGGRG